MNMPPVELQNESSVSDVHHEEVLGDFFETECENANDSRKDRVKRSSSTPTGDDVVQLEAYRENSYHSFLEDVHNVNRLPGGKRWSNFSSETQAKVPGKIGEENSVESFQRQFLATKGKRGISEHSSSAIPGQATVSARNSMDDVSAIDIQNVYESQARNSELFPPPENDLRFRVVSEPEAAKVSRGKKRSSIFKSQMKPPLFGTKQRQSGASLSLARNQSGIPSLGDNKVNPSQHRKFSQQEMQEFIEDLNHETKCPSKLVQDYVVPDEIVEEETSNVKELDNGSQGVIMHGSEFRYKWTMAMLVLTGYCAFAYPYIICFDVPSTTGWILSDLFLNVFFMSDIYVTSISVIKLENHYITDKKIIQKLYFGSFAFLFDCLACIPIEIIDLVVTAQGSDIPSWLKVVRLLRLLRVSKFRKIMLVFLNDQSEAYLAWFQLYLIMFYILMITHYIACLWYVLGLIEDFPSNFFLGDTERHFAGRDNSNRPTRNEFFLEEPKLSQYIYGVTWALTALTGSALESEAMTVVENIFICLVAATGMCIYATVIAQVSGILDSKNRVAREYEERTAHTLKYLKKKGVPPEVLDTVTRYFEAEWQLNEGVDEEAVLGSLSTTLRNNVLWHIRSQYLNQVNVLSGLEESQQILLTKWMRLTICVPQDVIFAASEPAFDTVFILDGDIQVVFAYERANAMLYGGDFLGFSPRGPEIAVVLRTYSALSVSYSNIFLVDNEHMCHLLQSCEPLQHRIMLKARTRGFS